ncbi:hypothetical protein [Pinibacter soli]|uniref:HNH endonuclease n=1 Tax=Pinibacter soli TaxID=3044211 RepID=A0ABT6RBY3_9BACT|nr:hypothetical protein [Pinibacter soli]MDI3319966.1 hypothetical protein [Pinibacter soli]
MEEQCRFPLCKRHPEKNGYCIGHRIYASGVVVEKQKKVNKESEKQKDIKKALKSAYPAFLAKRPNCEIQSPVCTKKATVVHHTQGRGKNEVLNQGTWMACCERCNGWVEDHHAEAEEKGFKKSRHKKKA